MGLCILKNYSMIIIKTFHYNERKLKGDIQYIRHEMSEL
jgi:hypothetical protein